MTKIRILDSLTVSKIAAGEVIERPASIVKELVENSIDAGANQITVEILDAGKTLIRVTDDGEGMNMEDLLIAFERHTTSKLSSAEDLESISTLGFRGEALSSIAAVSSIEVMTRTGLNASGIQAVVINGIIDRISTVGTPVGTTMIVRDLFNNIPVRKKFLKSNSSEEGGISDMLLKLAIGNPQTAFKYIKDSKIVFSTTGKGDLKNNIFQLIGRDIVQGLIPFEISSNGLSIKGFISNNNLHRGNRNHQYLFVNGRYVVDYKLSRIVEQQYSSLIPGNRYPLFFLFMNLNPSQIDINIHPTKQEIRFSSDSTVYTSFEEGLKNYLRSILKVPEMVTIEHKDKEHAAPNLWDLTKMNLVTEESSIIQDDLVVIDYSNADYDAGRYSSLVVNPDLISTANINGEYIIDFDLLVILGILFNTYIIAEDKISQTMCVIDQHAAHERIMYEKLQKDFNNESVAVQQLITPIIIELTPSEFRKAIDYIEHFNSLGFEVDPFGEKSIALRGVPLVFGNPNGKDLFLDILDGLDEFEKGTYELRVEKIMKLACSSAVKAGDRLDPREINSLLDQLKKCENPLTCPHGRPTIIRMTKRELEKKFLRIV